MLKLGIFKAHASKPTASSNTTGSGSVPSYVTVPRNATVPINATVISNSTVISNATVIGNATVPSSSFILETSEQGFHESSWNSKLNPGDPFQSVGSGLENSDKTRSNVGDIDVEDTSTSGGWTNPLDQIDAFSSINPVDSPDNFEDFLQSLK